MTPRRPAARAAAIPAAAVAAALALALAGTAACTSEQRAFTPNALTSCVEGRSAVNGDPCRFLESCSWLEPSSDGGCCAVTAQCRGGRFVRDASCVESCGELCVRGSCAGSGRTCLDGRCMPCPPTDHCAPCPTGWIGIERDGCRTCECAPVSQCDVTAGDCGPGDQCYLGSRCVSDCGLGCCIGVCGPPGCPPLAPQGCPRPCSVLACDRCALEQCQCMPDGQWQCLERCMDGEPVAENLWCVLDV